MELDGHVEADFAQMRAKLRIQINHKDGWVRVPVRLDEAVLQTIKHSGPGDAFYQQSESTTGHDWWMHGNGLHELTVECIVPTKRQGTSQRLQLQLPPSAIATLKLRLSQVTAAVRGADGAVVRTRSVDDPATGRKVTDIDASGFGARLDLAWEAESSVSSTESVLEVATNIFVSLVDGEAATQEVTQRVQALQGNFEELRVRLPGGCELLRFDAAEITGYRVDPTDANLVIVKLKRLTTGPVDLRWTVRSKSSGVEAQFVLDGFEVERARIQTGQIAVGLVGDFRLTKKSSDDRFVQRINLSDLSPSLRRSEVASAYRILNQPYRLVLALEKVEPLVSVEPWQFLSPSADHLDLENVYLLNIRRGGVSELVMRWAGDSGDDWSVVRVDPPARIEPINDFSDSASAVRLVRLRFIEPLRGNTELRVLTRKRIEPAAASPLRLVLPSLDAAYHTPATILLPYDEMHAVDVLTNGEELSPEMVDLGSLRVAPPENWPTDALLAVKLGTESHQVTIRSSDSIQIGRDGERIGRARVPKGVSISRSWIRTEATTPTSARSVERHRVAGPLSRVTIRFDKELVARRVLWDGQVLEPIQETEESTSKVWEFRLDNRQLGSNLKSLGKASPRGPRSSSPGEEHLLTIEYEITSFALGRVMENNRLVRPRIEPNLPVRELIWEVVLPSHRHLFSEPAELTPLYTWRHESWFWSRTSMISEGNLARWMQVAEDDSPSREPGMENRYFFTHLGTELSALREIEFSSMSQSEIVLFGAGMALFLGLVLIKVPATRNVLTGLSLAFVVAGLALWQTSPILVLIQPAGLGVLLAVSAAVIDGWVKRRRNARGLTITSPSGFVSAPSSVERQRGVAVGSNDFTALRTDPAAIAQQVTTSEAGMRP